MRKPNRHVMLRECYGYLAAEEYFSPRKEPTGERIEREGIMNPNNNPAAARMMLANGKIANEDS